MRIPDNLCLSTLRPIRGGFYSAGAMRTLFGGQRVPHLLQFEQKEFAEFRQEAASRISISGVQDKISLRLVDGQLTPTDREGEFILKPVPNALAGTLDLVEDVPANEHVTMQIAAQVFGLRTAECGLVFFPDGEPAYLVRRFDRDPESSRKLAQEDFCQLAGRSRATDGENYKYDGSYEEVGRLLREYCGAWKVESEKLFALVAFNYVCGNGDAHLKNFSVLETPMGDSVLSPAYDLLNTSLHLPTESRTALDFFDDLVTPSFKANGFFKRPDFLLLAKQFGLREQRAEAILNRFAHEKDAVLNLLDRSLLSDSAQNRFGTLVLDRLRAIAD